LDLAVVVHLIRQDQRLMGTQAVLNTAVRPVAV
jgi:hypothetical protein